MCWPRPFRSLPSFFPLPALPLLLQGSFRALLVPRSLPLLFPAQAQCTTVARPGSGWGCACLRFARPACCTTPCPPARWHCVRLRVSSPLRPVPRHRPPAALVPFPAAPAAASRRRVCSLCFFWGGGGAEGEGGGGGGGFRVVPSPGVCTLRARCELVAWHLSARGGPAPFPWLFLSWLPRLPQFPRGTGALWGGGGLLFDSLRHTLMPRVPAAGGKHDARTMQAQTSHSNHRVFLSCRNGFLSAWRYSPGLAHVVSVPCLLPPMPLLTGGGTYPGGDGR